MKDLLTNLFIVALCFIVSLLSYVFWSVVLHDSKPQKECYVVGKTWESVLNNRIRINGEYEVVPKYGSEVWQERREKVSCDE